jgi:hypothetical protein
VRREESMHTGRWTCIMRSLHLVTAIADKQLRGVRTAYPTWFLTLPTGTRQFIVVFHLKTLIHCLLKYYLRISTLMVFKKSSSTSPENRNLDIVFAFPYKLLKISQRMFVVVYDVSINFPIKNSRLAAIKSIWGWRYVLLKRAAVVTLCFER